MRMSLVCILYLYCFGRNEIEICFRRLFFVLININYWICYNFFLIIQCLFYISVISLTLLEEFWVHVVWRRNNWNWRPDARSWSEERDRCVTRKRFVLLKLVIAFLSCWICIFLFCLTPYAYNVIYYSLTRSRNLLIQNP